VTRFWRRGGPRSVANARDGKKNGAIGVDIRAAVCVEGVASDWYQSESLTGLCRYRGCCCRRYVVFWIKISIRVRIRIRGSMGLCGSIEALSRRLVW
jgi:hypothetical protein